MSNLKNISELRELLAAGVVLFRFKTVDNKVRTAYGTRLEEAAEKACGFFDVPNHRGHRNECAFFDVEEEGWRSYAPRCNKDGVEVLNESCDIQWE